jgi:hypothetical protein
MNLRDQLGLGLGSLEELRVMTGVERPASVKEMLARTVFSNDAGVPLVTGQTGRVHGTSEPSDRESAWDKSDRNGLIALHWEAIRRARAATTLDRDSDFFGAFGDVAEFLGSLGVGAAFAGPAGVCLVLGAHAADAAGLDEEFAVGGLPGLFVTGAVLLVFGPLRSSRRSWGVPRYGRRRDPRQPRRGLSGARRLCGLRRPGQAAGPEGGPALHPRARPRVADRHEDVPARARVRGRHRYIRDNIRRRVP